MRNDARGRDGGDDAASILRDIAYILCAFAQDLAGEGRSELAELLLRVQERPLDDGRLQDAVVKALSYAVNLRRTEDRGWVVDMSSILWAVHEAIYLRDTRPLEGLWCAREAGLMGSGVKSCITAGNTRFHA